MAAWKSSGWNDDRNVAMMLEFMVARGEVAADGRRGRDRLWNLAERVYPDDPVVPADEARRQRDELRMRSLGIARVKSQECLVEAGDVGGAGEPAVVEGVKGEWRVDPAQLDRPFRGRAALLSPLDRLVYDRKRMEELFGFDYQLEMYKPKAKRRWGYFALPILYGDRLVGTQWLELELLRRSTRFDILNVCSRLVRVTGRPWCWPGSARRSTTCSTST